MLLKIWQAKESTLVIVLNSYKTQTLSQTRQVSWKRHACSSFKLIKYWYRSKVKFNTWWFKWNHLHVFLLKRAGWIWPLRLSWSPIAVKLYIHCKDIHVGKCSRKIQENTLKTKIYRFFLDKIIVYSLTNHD